MYVFYCFNFPYAPIRITSGKASINFNPNSLKIIQKMIKLKCFRKHRISHHTNVTWSRCKKNKVKTQNGKRKFSLIKVL